MKKKTGLIRLIPYLKRHGLKVIIAILLIITAAILMVTSPYLEGMITTQLFSDVTAGHGVNFTKIAKIIAGLIVIYFTEAFCNLCYQFLLTDAIQNTMMDLRNEVEGKIRRLPIAFFDKSFLQYPTHYNLLLLYILLFVHRRLYQQLEWLLKQIYYMLSLTLLRQAKCRQNSE